MEDTGNAEILSGQACKWATSSVSSLSDCNDSINEVLLPPTVKIGEDRILEHDGPVIGCSYTSHRECVIWKIYSALVDFQTLPQQQQQQQQQK